MIAPNNVKMEDKALSIAPLKNNDDTSELVGCHFQW